MSKLSVIIPCYYNEDNIEPTTSVLISLEAQFDPPVDIEYILVDDGSKDNTLAEARRFQELHPAKVKVIKLSGNFGSYNAILAGMHYATGDVNVVLTADMQDPPELILKMYNYWKSGFKLVIANRTDREEPFFQRVFSNTYHRLMKKIAIKNIPDGGYDLVMFDQQLRKEVIKINEKNTNTLYLLSWLNYEYIAIPYTRRKREVGKSKWTLSKKIKLFVDSFVSFSYTPIKVISFISVIFSLLSFLYGLFIVLAKLFGIITVPGWAALMAVILFIASFQFIILSIIGEYLWRSLDASRNRPPFVVDEIYDIKE